MQMESYPPPAQIGTFYAQSVALVDYLTKLKGPLVLTQFFGPLRPAGTATRRP